MTHQDLPYKNTDLQGTLFVSPHSDDISICAGHIIATRALPEPLHLVTVFSRSDWVEPSWSLNLGHQWVTEIRLAEDYRFCQQVGAVFHSLDFEDCAIRYGSALFDPKIELEMDLCNQILDQLRLLCRRVACQSIAVQFPFGDGQHLDHRLTFHAVAALSVMDGLDCIYFDDLPYSRIPVNVPVRDIFGRLLQQVRLDLSPQDLARKIQLMNIYESQMCEYYFDSIVTSAPKETNHSTSESIWRTKESTT